MMNIVLAVLVLIDPPTGLQQRNADLTVIPPGGTAIGSTVVFRGYPASVNANLATLRVEVKLAGQPFNGSYVESAPVPILQLATVTINGLAAGQHQWRAWAHDLATGLDSQPVEFPGSPDFVIAGTNQTPDPPASLAQLRSDGTPLPLASSVSDGIVRFRAKLTDPDEKTLRLEIEVRTLGTPFSGIPTEVSEQVGSGETVTIQRSGLSGLYHWQARAVDGLGAPSVWVSFGPNGEGDADFHTWSEGPAGPSSGREGRNGDQGCFGAVPSRGFALWILLPLLLVLRRRPR